MYKCINFIEPVAFFNWIVEIKKKTVKNLKNVESIFEKAFVFYQKY